MKHSPDQSLTSHCGSLAHSHDLLELIQAKQKRLTFNFMP
jgi:hypothetical protein